jgi:DNA-binding IclR family transcriptional regulator
MSENDDEKSTAIQKAVRILEALVKSDAPVSLAEIAEATELAKPSAHRILCQLEDLGFVLRDIEGKAFVPGGRWTRLASDTLIAVGRQPAVKKVMRDLVDCLTETCNLAVLRGNEVLYIERVECEWPLRLQLAAGSRVPIHCTASGKLFLAYMEPPRRKSFISTLHLHPYTKNTIVDADRLMKECDRIRREAISINREEQHLGLIGVAVPVLRFDGRIAAALAVHAPVFRMSVASARKAVPLLVRAASTIAHVAGLA